MLTYEELQALAAEVQSAVIGKQLTRFELIKPRTFQLIFEKMPLLIGLQAGHVRFHLLRKPYPTLLDPFSHFFQKKLQDAVCTQVGLLNDDRLLELQFDQGLRLIAALFPKKPNLYLVNGEGMIESSLYPIKDPHFAPPHKPARVSTYPPSTLTSVDLEFQLAHQEAVEKMKSALDKAKQTFRSLTSQLDRCKDWEKLHHEGVLLQSNLFLIKPGMPSIELQDWETDQTLTLTLDPKLSPHENAAERFALAKRQQTGEKTLVQSVEKQKVKIQQLEHELESLTKATQLDELPTPEIKKAKPPPQKGVPYEEFFSEAGLPIWVGKGAAKNDLLTFKYAKGNDWWLHVQGYPGSHVVIRTSKSAPPDDETLQDALTLAIEHSKAKGEKYVEVLVTQRKFVSKLGKSGQVQVSQHKLLHSQVDRARLTRLKKKEF